MKSVEDFLEMVYCFDARALSRGSKKLIALFRKLKQMTGKFESVKWRVDIVDVNALRQWCLCFFGHINSLMLSLFFWLYRFFLRIINLSQTNKVHVSLILEL